LFIGVLQKWLVSTQRIGSKCPQVIDGKKLAKLRIKSLGSPSSCWGIQRRLFRKRAPMNYQAFTNDSLTMMYAAVRGALAADDAAERQGGEPTFKVRDTPEWKKHAADLESEMLRRGMMFEIIDWAEGQGSLPL
jgi:hypothetical protein